MSEQIQQLLDLETAPVAVTFHDTKPDGVSRVETVEASGLYLLATRSRGQNFPYRSR